MCALGCSVGCVRLFGTPWVVARQTPLSMGFPRQEYWSGLPCPPPWDLPDPGMEFGCPALAGGFFTLEPPGKPAMVLSTMKQERALKQERDKTSCPSPAQPPLVSKTRDDHVSRSEVSLWSQETVIRNKADSTKEHHFTYDGNKHSGLLFI